MTTDKLSDLPNAERLSELMKKDNRTWWQKFTQRLIGQGSNKIRRFGLHCHHVDAPTIFGTYGNGGWRGLGTWKLFGKSVIEKGYGKAWIHYGNTVRTPRDLRWASWWVTFEVWRFGLCVEYTSYYSLIISFRWLPKSAGEHTRR
jgi:hypothetical protein